MVWASHLSIETSTVGVCSYVQREVIGKQEKAEIDAIFD